jgi:hypothetical protein
MLIPLTLLATSFAPSSPFEALPVVGQGQVLPGPVKMEEKRAFLPTENSALQLAVSNVQTVSEYDQEYIRYIWVPSGSSKHAQACSLAVNIACNRGTVIVRPMPIGKDKLLLQRINLRHYSFNERDLEELVEVWEQFQFDPRFNLLLTKDTLEFSETKLPRKRMVSQWKDVLVEVPAYVQNGQTFTKKWIKTESKVEIDVDVVREVAPHLDKGLVAALIEATGSQAPIVSLPYFMFRSLSTIQDANVEKKLLYKNLMEKRFITQAQYDSLIEETRKEDELYKEIYGGLYYQLRGIKRGFKQGTDEENLFATFGIGNVKNKTKVEQDFAEFVSDGRVVTERSGVATGAGPRLTEIFRTKRGHTFDNTSFGAITRDLKRKSIDIGTHPIMNLIEFPHDASEFIAEGNTGLHVFALFDGTGNLLDQATDDVAADTTIPAPYGSVLQSAISCIRCHAKEGGWRILENDLAKLVGKKNLLDVFDDFSFMVARKNGKYFYHGHEYSRQEVIQRLSGLYSGDPEFLALPRARDDYARAILRATGPWEGEKDQTGIVQRACNEISAIYGDYWFKRVTAIDALHDLGVQGEWKDAKAAGVKLKELLPPPVIVRGIAREDPRIAMLMAGIGITRSDFDLVYSFMAARVKR